MCDAKGINGCSVPGTIQIPIIGGKYKTDEKFCSEFCANEFAAEVSEGTWCPFPTAGNALSTEQILENLTYFDNDEYPNNF